MKFGVFALAFLVAGASAVIYDTDVTTLPTTVDQEFINLIFRHNWQPLIFKEWRQFTDSPLLDETKYGGLEIYKTKIFPFFDLYNHGLILPRGRVGTFFDYKFLEQTNYLFNFFYYSADLPTLFQNIIWARENINELMFVHALHLVIFHRVDLQGIVLPPLYEILPNHFFTYDVIQKGIDYKLSGLWKLNNTFELTADYTSRYYQDRFYEQRLSYFTEDIGLNSFYYYFNLRYPLFLGQNDAFAFEKEPVGELWFYLHQQLIARYYLERVSNDLGEIYEFTWVKGIKNGYWPMLRYKNGVEFSYRSNFYGVDSYDSELLDLVTDFELRIRQMIDSGFITLGDKRYDIYDPLFADVLGNVITGNLKDNRFYRYVLIFYHLLVGGRGTVQYDSFWYVPSVFEHFETVLRDPVFYQLYDRIVGYYFQYKNLLPTYKTEDIYVPVKINDVIVSPLKTYFEYDRIDATNVVDVDLVEPNFDYSFFIRQPRLNYEPFDVKLLLDAEIAGEYTVRFFLGPKVLNRYQLNDVRQYFFELDHFITKLTVGKNTILRNSREFLYFFRDLVKYTQTGDVKYIDQYGFPAGLLLPKGKVGGMPFTFYTIIHKNDGKQNLGFPFDRQIDILNFFVPNMFFKDVIISQYVDYDIFADSPLNNIYYNDVIPMNSIRVPLNVQYYNDNHLDSFYWHFNEIYRVWYEKYLGYGNKNYGKVYGKKINYGGKSFGINKYGFDNAKSTYGYGYDTKGYYPFDYFLAKPTKKVDTVVDKKVDTKFGKYSDIYDKKYDSKVDYGKIGGKYDDAIYDKTYDGKFDKTFEGKFGYGKGFGKYDDVYNYDTPYQYDTKFTPKYTATKDATYFDRPFTTGRFGGYGF